MNNENLQLYVESVIADFRQGKMVIMVDDEDRENEGDLVIAGDWVTPRAINFMTRHGRGLVCLALEDTILKRFNLPMMTDDNQSKFKTGFTVSVEAASGVTTGISAFDRARTIKVMMDPKSQEADIVSPGHIFPLRAKENGVMSRRGQTEGSVDLARLSGLQAGAVICEVLAENGGMARRPELEVFAKQHAIKIISVEQLVQYRSITESQVELVSSARLPVRHLGEFMIHIFQDKIDGSEHVALVKEKPREIETLPLVRLHSACLTGDIFGSARCDCGAQLNSALAKINQEGGALLYLSQEGRGIGLSNKIKAYRLQEEGFDTVEANTHLGFAPDERCYRTSAHILKALKIESLRLLTNNPQKISALKQFGVKQVIREPLQIGETCENRDYLQTKKNKLGHLLILASEEN
jgi:3,4-dihydroxy 2-butanone 4-phosphate synthase/GTP cyclohydrolase II